MKLLFIGSCSSFFLVPLAKALKDSNPQLHLGVLDLVNPSGEVQEHELLVFDEIHHSPKTEITGSKSSRLLVALRAIIRDQGLGRLILMVLGGQIKKAVTNAESQIIELQNREELKHLFSRYDVIQTHYLKASNLQLAELAPPEKLILSFWGSDLLQDEGELARSHKLKILDSAKAITVQNEDLRQIIAIKYGWDFYQKVQCNLFLPNQTIFNQIKQGNRQDAIKWLRTFGPVDEDAVTVLLGYNSRPAMRVQETLDFLLNQTEDVITRLHFVFTFSYGKNEQTEREIVALLQHRNIPFTVINRYLKDEEMAIFRLSVDVLFQVPHTDAFSTTMIEHLYAGARVIIGTWLPYGKLRRTGLTFREIENYQQIPFDFLSNQRLMNNPPLLDQMYEQEQSTQKWLEIYRSV